MDKYDKLLEWMKHFGIRFNKHLEIKQSKLGGVGVFATKDISADEDSSIPLLLVPKETILSPENSGIANILHEAEIGGMVGLILAFLFEKSLGEQSPWFPYLDTIDINAHNAELLPRFWSDEEKDLLKGTELALMDGTNEDEVSMMYEQVVTPFLEENKSIFKDIEIDYARFWKASIVVSCGAFEVDNFHELALVPGADLFNHSDKENAHFETSAQVCPLCGALFGCEHEAQLIKMAADAGQDNGIGEDLDWEDEENEEEEIEALSEDGKLVIPESDDDEKSEEDEIMSNAGSETSDFSTVSGNEDLTDSANTCDVILFSNVARGEEIFNTYGELGNGILLSKYGFSIWDNFHDTVNLGKEVSKDIKAKKLSGKLTWWKTKGYPIISGYLKEKMKAELPEFEEDDEEDEDEDEPSWHEQLFIDEDGHPSACTYALAKVITLPPGEYMKIMTGLSSKKKKLIKTLLRSYDQKTRDLIQHWIQLRSKAYKDGGLTSKEYNKIIETLPQQEIRKKFALITVGSEKIKLEAAIESLKSTDVSFV